MTRNAWNDDDRMIDASAFDEAAGTFEGRSFPTEDEWLGLAPSADLTIDDDFVARTIAAIRAPTEEQLEHFEPPAVSDDFVSRTLFAIQDDRRRRWRELLARYVAPEPSAEFVSRTLHALAARSDGRESDVRESDVRRAGGSRGREGTADRSTPSAAEAAPERRPGAVLRMWALPLLAAAAVLIVAFLLPQDEVLPIERRAAETQPAAFGVAHAASPLPALLVKMDQDDDPYGLPNTGGDGVWLMLQRSR